MNLDTDIDPEKIAPWHEHEPPFPMFQEMAWVNGETAAMLVLEREQGPYGDIMNYQLVLMREGTDADPKNYQLVEDGLSDAEQAAHEAEAMMITDSVEENADG